MSHGLKLLLIAAGAIITCIVVVVGFQLTKSGKNDTNQASEQFTTVMAEYDELKLTCYQDQTVSGSEVIHYIKDNAFALADNQITQIKVTTKEGGEQLYKAADLMNVTEVAAKVRTFQASTTAAGYVNPSGKFDCSVERNNNLMVTNVLFVQR